MQADVQRLHFPIAKAIELRQLHERNPVVSQIVAQFHAGTDHLLSWDAVSFLRDRAHEVHATWRHDIGLEAVLPQVSKKFDLWPISAFLEQAAKLGMPRRRQPSACSLLKVLIGYARMGGEGQFEQRLFA